MNAARSRSSSTADEEQDLVARIAARDESALEELYRRFEPRIMAFAYRRLNDPGAAADTLNEVMLEVWKSAERFEGRSSVATWILSITRHRVIDRLRARGGRIFEEIDEGEEDTRAVDAEAAMAGAADAGAVRDCIEELPDAQREAVHLAFFEDMAYADIAQVMECPEGTVKTRVYHAKKALKDCLAGAEISHA